jgi:ketosteroid isomerase-like protein
MMDQAQVADLERRFRRVEDDLAIRNLAARFTDAVNERDANSFRQLWTNDAVWEIGPPLSARADGPEAIVEMFVRLLEPKSLFIQLTHSGVIDFNGDDTATARFTERERGKGLHDYYENLAVYRDDLARTSDGWRFKRRNYEYRYLDTSAIVGDVFAPGFGLAPAT